MIVLKKTVIEMDKQNKADSSGGLHKFGLSKVIQILLICQIIEFFTEIIGVFNGLSSINIWISRVVSITMIFVFLQMAIVNERYLKASLFYGISVGGTILLSVLGKSMFALVFSLCSIIACYHELNAHSEITASIDAKLSKRWHSLFYLELTIGLLAGLLSVIPIIIATMAGADPNTITSITKTCATIASVFLNLLRVIYLKQTLSLYRN